MAATFNLLRGRDLIWNYVVNNYLLGQEPPPFDLLHWNGDVTNLPAGWHRDYLETLYKANKLVEKGGISVAGAPIDLGDRPAGLYPGRPRGPYRAAAERVEDHGPFRRRKRFVLAGSGHIAGVVNPPAAGKYQYWTNDEDAGSLDEFIAGATEHKGSWWPDWLEWMTEDAQGQCRRPARGCRARAN